MAEPTAAKTNKPTWLLRVGDPSIWLKKGQALTVFGENGGWGTVEAIVNNEACYGSVDTDDYDP